MIDLLINASLETLAMIFISMIFGILIGIPIGLFLYTSCPRGINPRSFMYQFTGFIVNTIRSTPFVILIIMLIPLTRFVTGSSIGIGAAIVPLSIAAIVLLSRIVEEAIITLPDELKDLGFVLRASNTQHVFKILLPEALPAIVSGSVSLMINLVGYSAIAGTVGGGGLGDLAIRYGYQRYDMLLMIIIVVILIALVQLIQLSGNYLSNKLRKD